MKITRFLTMFTVAAVAVTIAACGGSDGDSTADVGSIPEGTWYGSIEKTGLETVLIVLDDGETWGLYADPYASDYRYANAGVLYGEVRGQSNGRFSGSIRDFAIGDGVYDGTLDGTFIERSEITATARGEEGEVTFSGSYDDWYDQSPMSLEELAGTYNGIGVAGTANSDVLGGGDDIPVTIDGAGNLLMPADETGCSASGTIAPRSNGKNVFDLSVTFHGASCVLEAVRGIALAEDDGLVAMAINPSRDGGFLYIGGRGSATLN